MNTKTTPTRRGTNAAATSGKTPAGKLSPLPVHFEYRNDAARKVCLAGTFNNWRPENAEMVSQGAGKWAKDLALAPGSYEYRLVVDGQWLHDPQATRQVPNPYGGENSIKVVPPIAPATTRLSAATPTARQLALGKY